ncbi:MAG: iron ABC transporter permease [Planctomycetota bacterium]
MRTRTPLVITLLLVGLAAAAMLRLLVGGERFGFASDAAIAELRWLRVVLGVGVGAGLAQAGVMLQALLRNPLASPDLLGLSAGAGLAVMLTAYIGYIATGAIAPIAVNPLPAVAGSCGALAIVYAFSQRRGFLDPLTLILVGVIVGILLGSASSVVRQLLPDGGFQASRLVLGRLSDDTPWWLAWLGIACATAGTAVGVRLGPAMDAASMSDDEAASVGVRVRPLRIWLFTTAGTLTAVTVVIAGPIGFVGLVVPHAARMLLGPAHRPLSVAAPILGAAVVVAGDALVRTVELPSGRLPLGVVTSLVGGPIFLLMLRSMLRR